MNIYINLTNGKFPTTISQQVYPPSTFHSASETASYFRDEPQITMALSKNLSFKRLQLWKNYFTVLNKDWNRRDMQVNAVQFIFLHDNMWEYFLNLSQNVCIYLNNLIEYSLKEKNLTFSILNISVIKNSKILKTF